MLLSSFCSFVYGPCEFEVFRFGRAVAVVLCTTFSVEDRRFGKGVLELNPKEVTLCDGEEDTRGCVCESRCDLCFPFGPLSCYE